MEGEEEEREDGAWWGGGEPTWEHSLQELQVLLQGWQGTAWQPLWLSRWTEDDALASMDDEQFDLEVAARQKRYEAEVADLGAWIAGCESEEECNELWFEGRPKVWGKGGEKKGRPRLSLKVDGDGSEGENGAVEAAVVTAFQDGMHVRLKWISLLSRPATLASQTGEEREAGEEEVGHPSLYDFMRSFGCDPNEVPPANAADPVDRDSLHMAASSANIATGGGRIPEGSSAASVPGHHPVWIAAGDDGAELPPLAATFMECLSAGEPGVARLLLVIQALPLPREDWQCLFLVWLRTASVDTLLSIRLDLLVDVLRALAAVDLHLEVAEAAIALATMDDAIAAAAADGDADMAELSARLGTSSALGGSFPLLYSWCRGTSAVAKALLLARLCAVVSKEMSQAAEVQVRRAQEEWRKVGRAGEGGGRRKGSLALQESADRAAAATAKERVWRKVRRAGATGSLT